MNKIKWVLNRLFCYLLNILLNICFHKNKKKILFGCKPAPYTKDAFIHNTKYLFLSLQNNSNYQTLFLCDNTKLIQEFKKIGIKNIAKRNSLKGIWAILTSAYWFCDITANQVTRFNAQNTNAIIINLWHGASGLKKVGYDAIESQLKFKRKDFQDCVYKALKKMDNYYITNSSYESQCRKSAFGATEEQIVILGSPRLDVLYKDIPNAEIFMEEDFNNIKNLKKEGKNLIIYMPTFRDTGKDISGWLKSDRIRIFLKNTNSVLICKLHPFDKNVIDFSLGNEFYKMANDSDVYPILKYTDALITDYSSVYFDYLHLNKPIIYYIPDLKEYETKCRGFYRPYETLTAGIYAKNEDELLQAMQDIVNGIDNYKAKRKALLDEMFVFQDGNNCKRVIDWLNSLEE